MQSLSRRQASPLLAPGKLLLAWLLSPSLYFPGSRRPGKFQFPETRCFTGLKATGQNRRNPFAHPPSCQDSSVLSPVLLVQLFSASCSF